MTGKNKYSQNSLKIIIYSSAHWNKVEMFRSYSFNLRIIPKQQRDNKGVVLFLKHFNKHHKVIFFWDFFFSVFRCFQEIWERFLVLCVILRLLWIFVKKILKYLNHCLELIFLSFSFFKITEDSYFICRDYVEDFTKELM